MLGRTEAGARSRRAKGPSAGFWLGVVVVLLAAGYLIVSSMSHTVYYYPVDQVVQQPSLVGQRMRVQGAVVEGSHHLRRGTLDDHLFLLGHDSATLTVVYRGALPDQFGEGRSVVATGILRDDGFFEAERLTTQCPSRYQGQVPTSSALPRASPPEAVNE